MLTKTNIKTLMANTLAAYHKGLLQEAIKSAVDTHNAVMASTSAPGHMTAAQVTKLNGIAEKAEVNQNALSNVKVGATTVAATAKTDTVEIVAGDNIEITADAATKAITITGAYQPFSSSSEGLVPQGSTDATKFLAATGVFKVIQDGTTAQKGIVQLNDAIDSTSTVQAATANAVKKALDSAKTYADGVKSSLLGDAPIEALDTLKELGDALNNDKNFAATMTAELAKKSDNTHTHVGSDLKLGTYAIASAVSNVTATDNISVAIGKVEKRVTSLADAGAEKWATARKLTLSGAVTGNVSIDGSKDVTLNATLSNLASNKVTAMTGYSLSGITQVADVTATDSLNAAVGKVEYRIKNLSLSDLFGTDTTGANLSQYGITDAYTKSEGTALAGRVTTVENTLTSLGGVEDVTAQDVTDIISAVQTAINA